MATEKWNSEKKTSDVGCLLVYCLLTYVLNFFFIKYIFHPCFPKESPDSLGFFFVMSPVTLPFEILIICMAQFGNLVSYLGGFLI
jgi:hypothetical protein